MWDHKRFRIANTILRGKKQNTRHNSSRLLTILQSRVIKTMWYQYKNRHRVHAGGRERDLALWLLFLYVFSSPGPALCKLGQPGVLFVPPEVLTLVLGPSFVLFSQAFPFLVFQTWHFGLLFPILTI